MNQLANQIFEDPPAVLIIFKLVEAGACGSQQDCVAGNSLLGRKFDGARHRSGAVGGNDASEFRFNLVRGRANQEDAARVASKRFPQDGIVAAFVLASENHQQIPGKRIERFQRGVHILSLIHI